MFLYILLSVATTDVGQAAEVQQVGVCHASKGGGDSMKDPPQGRVLIYGRPLATEGPWL